jgi:hypothetical protein
VINLLSSAADVGDLNSRGYVEFWVEGTRGSNIQPATMLDAAAEFMVTGEAAANVTFNGAAERISDSIYRYYFTGAFGTGSVSFHFTADTFRDNNAVANISETELFTAAGVRSARVYPNSVVFGSSCAHTTQLLRYLLHSHQWQQPVTRFNHGRQSGTADFR